MGLSPGKQPTRGAPPVHLTIITGYSGAGKSTALNAFEDEGYYCVDNLPVFLLPGLVEGLTDRGPYPRRLAVVMDSRDPAFHLDHAPVFERLTGQATCRMLFLHASEQALLRRYSQLRRVHPLARSGSLRAGIRAEREQLASLRQEADQLLDTSEFSPHDLRRCLREHFIAPGDGSLVRVSLLSFGYKHGLPEEADLVFDVRFLPNPYFVPDLSPRTGLEPEVAAYVLDNEVAGQFLEHLRPLLAFLLPHYRQEGKAYLTVGIGCTGGRHRSVAVVEALKQVAGQTGFPVSVVHRDLHRD